MYREASGIDEITWHPERHQQSDTNNHARLLRVIGEGGIADIRFPLLLFGHNRVHSPLRAVPSRRHYRVWNNKLFRLSSTLPESREAVAVPNRVKPRTRSRGEVNLANDSSTAIHLSSATYNRSPGKS